VRFYPRWVNPPVQVSGEVKTPVVIPYYEGITLLDVLRNVELKANPRVLKALIYRDFYTGTQLKTFTQSLSQKELKDLKRELEKELDYIQSLKADGDSGELSQREADIKAMLAEVESRLRGYHRPSAVAHSVYLLDLLVKGAGNVELLPGDRVVVKKTEATEKDRTVTILGEVEKPGIYRLEEGMTLYDLILRAGGYTPKAYPKGLVFIRESVKRLQEEHLQTALATLEETLIKHEEGMTLTGVSPEERTALEITLRKQKELLKLIKTRARLGLGRIALDIPERLEDLKDSPSNILLEDGDYVYVPSRPNYVLVIGGVYNQISLPYREGKPLSFYLEQVGGLTRYADSGDIYVIKANGRVISMRNYDKTLTFEWRDRKLFFARDILNMPLEEGDTVVVPTKLRVPTMWRPLIRDVVQIIFQAISTAVLAKRL